MKSKKTIVCMMLVFILVIATGMFSVMAATVSTNGSFEEEEEGASAAETGDFSYDWMTANGNADATSEVKSENGNKFMRLNGFTETYTYDLLNGGYSFSADIKTAGAAAVMIFLKAGQLDGSSHFPFYEWDWYVENGGTNGTSGIGGTGIGIAFLSDGVQLVFKNKQTDGSFVSSTAYKFTSPEGYKDPADNFNNISCVDEGERLTISLNGKLLATVELSNKGTYDDESEKPHLQHEYYKTAVVKDKAGTEVLNLSNARVVAEDYCIAIGNRDSTVDIDNITITREVEDATPSPEATEKTDATPTAKADPTEKANTPSAIPDETENGLNTGTIVIIIAAAAVVTAAVIIIIVKQRKKK